MLPGPRTQIRLPKPLEVLASRVSEEASAKLESTKRLTNKHTDAWPVAECLRHRQLRFTKSFGGAQAIHQSNEHPEVIPLANESQSGFSAKDFV